MSLLPELTEIKQLCSLRDVCRDLQIVVKIARALPIIFERKRDGRTIIIALTRQVSWQCQAIE